jgi:hypothetical protein
MVVDKPTRRTQVFTYGFICCGLKGFTACLHFLQVPFYAFYGFRKRV